MQNKGVIRFFAIILALVCAYQLSFTFKTYLVRQDAQEYALQNLDPKFKTGDLTAREFSTRDSLLQDFEFRYLDSLMNEEVYNLLVAQYTLRECMANEINLGLDLQGGMNVILEISVKDILNSLSNKSTNPTYRQAVQRATEMQTETNQDFVDLFVDAFEEIDPGAQLSTIFTTRELQDKIKPGDSNEEVRQILRNEAQSAIDNAYRILSSRIDKFGVAQPRIQKLESQQGRILVELPGVKDQKRVRKILQSTANLEFYETYQIGEIAEGLMAADEIVAEIYNAKQEERKNRTEISKKDTASLTDEERALMALDSLSIQEDTLQGKRLFSLLYPVQDMRSENSYVGRARARDTSEINSFLRMPQIKEQFPRDIRFIWDAISESDDKGRPSNIFWLHAIKEVRGGPVLTGDVINNANADFDQNNVTDVEVNMSMNKEGTNAWAKITKANIDRSIAVVLDNSVYSSPVVNTEINTGQSRITGNFDINEAQDLANMLKSGKLPVPATIVQDQIIGPSLGEEAVNSGLTSFILAFMVILLYMVFYYSRKAGSVADLALVINMYFIIGVLASMGAALTLPGIAGIVLTIGMSVDANVLIYERIREELAAGKGLKLAVKDGYKNAYSAIIDANITTLLTGVILYLFGTGPIKGFATTLVIGILTSLFCAIFITRLVFIGMMDRNKEITFDTSITKNLFKNAKIDFIGKRKVFYVISGLIIAFGVYSLATKGLNLGVDFKGGRTYVVRFEQEKVSNTDVANLLKDVFGEAPDVVTYGNANQVRVMTKYMIDSNDPETDDKVEELLYQGLKPMLGDMSQEEFFSDKHLMETVKVGPTIADDIYGQALRSIFFALLFMFIYIVLRFRNWQFGLGALLALVHDVSLVLGLFSIFYGILPFSLEIDQAFVAAILTVVGYSINDTVVVFDRIRENIALYRKRDDKEIMNLSMNGTLSRTFSTSLSTFFVLLVIFLFGGEVIQGFTFALLVGVVVGTYSSLFIASPVVYDTIKKQTGKHALSGKRRT